ncbi:MAG TPA: hypothetical protein VH092_16285 [Urbifossiella sp.]|nr:hypothetical protein [Urbifossiella sp.]
MSGWVRSGGDVGEGEGEARPGGGRLKTLALLVVGLLLLFVVTVTSHMKVVLRGFQGFQVNG